MRTVYATIISVDGETEAKQALVHVQAWINGWYRRRDIGFTTPSLDDPRRSVLEPADGHQLDIHVFSRETEPATTLCDLTWTYPDDYDKGLGWHVHLSIYSAPTKSIVSLELAIFGRQFNIQPTAIRLGPPRIVRELTSIPSARLAGYPYDCAPQFTRADAVENLCKLLSDANRTFPVVLVSRELVSERPLVDIDALASGLSGLMKIYELADKWAAFRLTEEVGKELSCYAGAVRIYWPGFSKNANGHKHPAWMPWRLKQLSHTDELTEQFFALGAEATAFRHIEPIEIVRFRNNALDDERIRRRIESSKDADTLLEQLIKTEDLLKAANSALETANGENHTLKQNLDALIGASPVALTEEAREPEVPSDEPASVVAAVELAEASTQHLLYLPSAIESAKESPYRSPDRALEALQAIDEVAGLWIAGLNGAKNPGPLKLLFKQRGFEYKDDVSQTSRGKWSEEYSASYDGRPIDISPHITIGAKQADTCLSIHMHWDKESKKVIVAHIGRHKINTKT